MTREHLQDRLNFRPFRPFRVHTDGGTGVYDVRHPEMVMLLATDLLVARMDTLVDGLPSRFSIVPYAHIARVEPITEAAPASS